MDSTLVIAIVLLAGIFGITFLLKNTGNNVKLIIYGCLACFFLIYFFIKKEYYLLLFAIIGASPILKFLFEKQTKEKN